MKQEEFKHFIDGQFEAYLETKPDNPALFWSGKMSTLCRILNTVSLKDAPYYLEQINYVREKYDEEIFKRVK